MAQKLGIKPGTRLHLIAAPRDYSAVLGPLPPDSTVVRRVSNRTDIVQLFTTERATLETKLRELRATLRPDAAVWVSWPKRSSKVATDVTEDVIREVALPLGFVDVKVCAVTEVWSGLRLVVRKELR
ncbi:MAG: DUF3052 domain-containing protein [Longimicrobiales bacterium]